MAEHSSGKTLGAERGLGRFEGFSDAVFAIALTLLIVEIKVPGSPEGPASFASLTDAIAEQWREHLALFVCYGVIGAYWLQHHYSGRIFAKSDHGLSAANLLFLLAIVVVPYPIRIWCFHIGTEFESSASVILVSGLALTACTWMIKWFYGMSGGRRVMDQRLDPGFLKQMMRRYGFATLIQIASIPVTAVAPRVGVALCLLCGAWFLLPQPKPRYRPGREPNAATT
ncbi:TMEM175 family protein [Devosia aurantiaca]|uniref:DUF1211 domain-containing protein n=1 Tax=Devosia aurantiaca TaxID=2714858 RepID=A0A6M1SNE1_9HYPH|nr:TMEM175 family protein [Devosia aurantiaca]NGP17012.1 DUF1211 domain-containing protein [Devosia aurantiaca]